MNKLRTLTFTLVAFQAASALAAKSDAKASKPVPAPVIAAPAVVAPAAPVVAPTGSTVPTQLISAAAPAPTVIVVPAAAAAPAPAPVVVPVKPEVEAKVSNPHRRNFYIDFGPYIGTTLFAADKRMSQHVGLELANLTPQLTLGIDFVGSYNESDGNAVTPTQYYSIKVKTIEYNLGLRANYYFTNTALSWYFSPAVAYRWVRGQFERASDGLVSRDNSDSGAMVSGVIGYRSQPQSGGLGWQAGVGVEYLTNKKKTLVAGDVIPAGTTSTSNVTADPQKGVRPRAELSLMFLF